MYCTINTKYHIFRIILALLDDGIALAMNALGVYNMGEAVGGYILVVLSPAVIPLSLVWHTFGAIRCLC